MSLHPDTTSIPTDAGRRRPAVGFVAVCAGYFAIILDGSVLNVAVPAIRTDLGGSLSAAQWVISAYTLALAALLLTAGALSDRLGLRRAFRWGVSIFTVASVGCAAAPSVAVLVISRVAQGLGAAALLPATLALIPHLFSEPHKRARATMAWVAVGTIAVAVGPLLGGLLIDSLGWRSIFLLNLPIGAVSVILGSTSITETPRHRRKVDYAGQITVIPALGLITAAAIFSGEAGWGSPVTLGLLIGGIFFGAAFWIIERRSGEPMLPPSFFTDRVRSSAVASAAFMGFLFYGTLFVMSLYFQQFRGWSAGAAGLALLPLTVGSTVGPLAIYRPLARRFGHPAMLVAGFSCCAAGIALLSVSVHTSDYPFVAVGLLFVGVSSTIAFSALTSLLVPSVPAHQSGMASGVQNTGRQTGALMSVSVLGAILNSSSFGARLPIAFAVLGVVVVMAVFTGIFASRVKLGH